MTVKRLPGQFRMYQYVSIVQAIIAFRDRFGVFPQVVAVHTSYRISDSEAEAMQDCDAQLVMLDTVHGVYCGPVPE